MNPVTVTRVRPTEAADVYGATVYDWSASVSVTIPGCMIAPVNGSEDNGAGRTGRVIGWSLYRRQAADIHANDRIIADGHTYSVDGEPEVWDSPHTGFSGIVASLQRAEG